MTSNLRTMMKFQGAFAWASTRINMIVGRNHLFEPNVKRAIFKYHSCDLKI